MHTPARLIATLATLGFVSAVSAQTTLVNDTFTGAVRVGGGGTGNDTPVTGLDRDGGTSNDWVVTSNFNNMAGSAGGPVYFDAINAVTAINGTSLRVNNTGGFYDLKTNFAATTIAPGQSITVSFNVRTTLANPTGGSGFRIGLFDSGGTRQTANLTGYGNALFNDDKGYTAVFTPNATATTTTAGSIQDRSAGVSTNGLFQGTLTTLTNSATPTVGGAIDFNINHAVTFSISRSLDGLTNTISSSFGGASITATDTTLPYTTFDELGIFFGSGWGNATTPRQNFIDDVLVTYSGSAIPEPSAFAALAGLAALGLVGLRRRAR